MNECLTELIKQMEQYGAEEMSIEFTTKTGYEVSISIQAPPYKILGEDRWKGYTE